VVVLIRSPLAFIDPEGDTLTFGLAEGTLSTGLSFAASGAFSATPSATLGTVGPVMVYAEDGHLDNVTTFTLTTAAATGSYPFTLGLGFKKADVPDSFCLDISTAQVVVKRRWNDGSVKHAIVSGHASLTQNVARTITVIRGHAAPGTALTSSDIQTAAPTASVQCGALGTVNLSSHCLPAR
jgi:hypothetical protein